MVDGVGQLEHLVDVRILGDAVGELLLVNRVQVTLYEFQGFGDL